MKQIERYVDEIDDNTKQFASVLNELPTNEDNQDNIMLQDIINKNEIATDNSIKLIETSFTEIGVEASTQTGGLTFGELEGLDRELRTISGSLRSAIAKSIAKQENIDKEKRQRKWQMIKHVQTSKGKKCELDSKDSKMNKKLCMIKYVF